MTHLKNNCLETQRLVRLIHEQFDEHDESEIVAHIDQCPRCQNALERAAAGQEIWGELQAHLAGELSSGLPATNTTHDNTVTRAEIELQKLQNYLGPTDDPDYLGRLGNYEVCGLIGQGSTGIVVKAFEPKLSRYVAIKILSPAYSSNGPARVRFERESRSVAAVAHEHVVPIFAVDEYRDLPYIVMQYVPGGSLQQRIDHDGPLDTCGVVRLGMQIAKGLSAAHAQGIVHRDVKPANVLLESNIDRAMVSDFGLARVADDAAMTRSGVIAGTPQYMSPEQAKGNPIDLRSDLFSLGSVMYTAATGRAPFRAETVFGVIQRVCETEPLPVREINPKIDRWLEAFINKLHSKNREDRFESAEQVVEILSAELAHLQGPSTVAAPERPWFTPTRKKRSGFSVAIALAAMFIIGSFFAASSFFNSDNSPDGLTTDQEDQKPGNANLVIANAEANSDKTENKATKSLPGKPGKFVTVAKKFDRGIIDGYMLYLPKSYDPKSEKPYPVIMYLQGGQAVGGKIDEVACIGLPKLLKEDLWKESEFEFARFIKDTFIVVCPHMTKGSFDERQFYNQEKAIALIRAEMIKNYNGDTSRVYLAGAGRGGHGTWGLATRMPNAFAAFVPVSGDNHGIKNHTLLTALPIWAAHDKRDPCVEYEVSLKTIDELDQSKDCQFKRVHLDDLSDFQVKNQNKVFVTLDCGCGSSTVFRNRKVYDWMLQYRSDSASRVKIEEAQEKHRRMAKALDKKLEQMKSDEKHAKELRKRFINQLAAKYKIDSNGKIDKAIAVQAGKFGMSAERYVSMITEKRDISLDEFRQILKTDVVVKELKKSNPQQFKAELKNFQIRLQESKTPQTPKTPVTPWSERKTPKQKQKQEKSKSDTKPKQEKNKPFPKIEKDWPKHTDTISKSFATKAGGNLFVDVGQGGIKLIAGSDDKSSVKVIREVQAETIEQAKELMKVHQVKFSTKADNKQQDADLKIEHRWPKEFLEEHKNHHFRNIQYEITMPAYYNVKLNTAGGKIEIADLRGTVDARTSGGRVMLGKIDGTLLAITSGGSVKLTECTQNAELRTSGGSIDVGTAAANLVAKTGGGRIWIAKVGGDVSANTSGGSIKIESASGQVDAETSGGSIQLNLTRQPKKNITLKTSAGVIRVGLQKGVNLKIKARSNVGSIQGPFIKRSRKLNNTYDGSLGSNGPTLQATNSAGSIRFSYLDDGPAKKQ